MHTTASDGLASVQDLLDDVARRAHLDVIAITDHDCLDASLWACEKQDEYSFEIIPGVEVSSWGGHVLGLWVTEPIPLNLSLAETAAAIHEQGGIAILAHPFHFHVTDVLRGLIQYWRRPDLLKEWGFDGVEILNAGILIPGCNAMTRRWCRQLDLSVIGSSDAHSLGAVGSGMTRFPGHTAEDLRAALLRRKTTVEGGVWPLADYIEIARALPRWNSPRPTQPKPRSEADVTLA
jgi:predicted metal-dependent phosphoesterase TrpH